MSEYYKYTVERSLPQSIHFVKEIRDAEQRAVKQLNISLITLMEWAGASVLTLCRHYYPKASNWLVLCGTGNNGGDGYVIARLAHLMGIHVTVIAVRSDKKLPVEADLAQQAWLQAGGIVHDVDTPWPENIDLIIDALLGIGLTAAPTPPYHDLIQQANTHAAPIVAVDIPSGLLADSGWAPGIAICAQYTLTFIALKPGVLTGLARNYCGKVHIADLSIAHCISQSTLPLLRLDHRQLKKWLLPRLPCAHKGNFGKLLVVGGNSGYGGAVRLAGEGALRSGAGLVRVLTHHQHSIGIIAACPELMVQVLDEFSLKEGIAWADVIIIGPGLGQNAWSQHALAHVSKSDKPTLWDADALNLLAVQPYRCQQRILTPHPGEAARLLGCSVAEIEQDRLAASRRLVKRYGGIVVLKGAGTIITSLSASAIADVGNPGMATAGMGDILSGIIGGLMAQKMDLYTAACAGCLVHGIAADSAAQHYGQRGILASDLLYYITASVNP